MFLHQVLEEVRFVATCLCAVVWAFAPNVGIGTMCCSQDHPNSLCLAWEQGEMESISGCKTRVFNPELSEHLFLVAV